MRLLAVEGVPSQAAAAARLAIPATVRDVIARRRAHLSEECNTRHPNPCDERHRTRARRRTGGGLMSGAPPAAPQVLFIGGASAGIGYLIATSVAG